MPISSLDRDLAELAAAVRLDGTLAALAGRASIGDAYMLGMLVSGMTVYGRTTSPVDLFPRINEENAKMIARAVTHTVPRASRIRKFARRSRTATQP
jgi:hypothetical protein